MAAILLAIGQFGCSDDEEPETSSNPFHLEIEGVPDEHTPEVLLSGDDGDGWRVIEESTTIDDLREGTYVLEARTITTEDKSWYVESSLTEFDFDPAQGLEKRLTYEPLELEVSDRAVGFGTDHDEAVDDEALLGTTELYVGDPEAEDYDPYEDTRELEFDVELLDHTLEEGDLLSFEPTEHLPYGYLGEVKNIDDDGDVVVATTRRAPLTDLIPQGAIAEVGNIKYEDTDIEPLVDEFYATPQYLDPAAQEMVGVSGFVPDVDIGDDGLCFEVDDLEIYDDDDGTVEVGGGFCLDADVSFDFRIVSATLDYANFMTRFEKNGNIWADIDGDVDFHTRESVPFAKLRLPPLTFSVGPVPVSINTYIRLMLEVGATADGELKAELSASNTLETGVRYAGDVSPVFRTDGSVDKAFDNHLNEYSVRGGVGPNLEFLVYDTAGPTFGVSAFAEYDVEVGEQPWWVLSLGLGGYVGFRLQLPGIPFFSVSEEVQVAERTWPIARSPRGEIGVQYYGHQPMDDDEEMLPCTTYEDVELQLIDPYEEEPEIEVRYREESGISSVEKVGQETGDDGEIITTWTADYTPSKYGSTQSGFFALLDKDYDRWSIWADFPVAGYGGYMEVKFDPPEGAEDIDGELVRLETEGLPDTDYQEVVDDHFVDACTPPGDYKLEMPAIEIDGAPYIPSVYEASDHARLNPLATGDKDGVSYQFFGGSDEQVAKYGYYRTRVAVDYEEAPSGSVTFRTGDDHLLTDGPALLHVEGVDVDFEQTYQFSEGNDEHHFQFHEDGTYELEVELPEYNGIPVQGGLLQGDGTYEFEVENHFEVSLSLWVPPASVYWLDPEEATLGSSGGSIDYEWDSSGVTGYTVEVDPPITDPKQLDADDDEFTIDFPANDNLETDIYEVTLTGYGAEEDETDTAEVSVNGLDPATIDVQPAGFGADDNASDAAELNVEGPNGDTWTATTPWPYTIEDVLPGEYTFGEDSVTGDTYDFATDETSIDVSVGEETTAAVQYHPTTATLEVGVEGPDGVDPTEIASIEGPDGFDETVTDGGQTFTHLSPGTYTAGVTDTSLDHDDGSTLEAVDTTLDTSLGGGDNGQLIVEYERVEGQLQLHRDANDAPVSPSVDVYDDNGQLVTTVDDDEDEPWLEPGVYTLDANDYYEADELFYPAGLGEVVIDADTTTVADVEYRQVTASFDSSPDTVRPDDSETTLQWNVDADTDHIDLSISPDVGSIGAVGDQLVTPDVDEDDDSYTYTLTASGDTGSVEWTVELNVSEDDLILEYFTVDGTDEVYVEPGDEVTFEWNVIGPEPDWYTIPFDDSDYDDGLPMEGSETVTTDELWCWGPECLLELGTPEGDYQSEWIYVHHADPPTLYADDDFHMMPGRTAEFEIDIGHEMYGTEGSFELEEDTMIDEIEMEDDNEYWQFDSDYTPPTIEITAADDAIGVEEVELTASNEFGEDTTTFDVHFGVTSEDDDEDDPVPGSLRWAVEEQSEPDDEIRFDPDLFADTDEPGTIELEAPIVVEHSLTFGGHDSEATKVQGPQDEGGVFELDREPDTADEMFVVFEDLAIVDAAGAAIGGAVPGTLSSDSNEKGLDVVVDGLRIADNGGHAINLILPEKDEYEPGHTPYSAVTIIDTVIESNDGEAVTVRGGESVEIISSHIENNSLWWDGSGDAPPYTVSINGLAHSADIAEPRIVIEDTDIVENMGRGVRVTGGPFEFIDSTITADPDYNGSFWLSGITFDWNDGVDYPQIFELAGYSSITGFSYAINATSEFDYQVCLDVGADVIFDSDNSDVHEFIAQCGD